ncbi:MAG: ABC transporter ATP-binding protein [Pseudomonadota bacterium]
MNGLEIDSLNFAYRDRVVLHGATIPSVGRGQLTALVGPNASGKSTLFKCVSGLLKVKSGEILLDGADLALMSLRTRLKTVCFMPQYFVSNAALSVFDVVLMACKNLTGWAVSNSDIERVASALQRCGISHLADSYIGELSGGQSQMVSIAQSLVREADVYLFDEPTSALDLRHQLSVLNQIKSHVVDRNAVGIVALHDLNLAARFADQLILLGNGRVRATGSPGDVLSTEALSDTYGVDIAVSTGPRREICVHAYPN